MDKKIEIKQDVFGIAKRIKTIDDGYFILYNLDKKFYELHNKKQPKNTFCLSFFKKNLDKTLIDKIYESRIENAKYIFETIEKENKKINKEIEDRRKNETEYKLKEFYDYVQNKSTEIDSKKMFSSNWV